MANANRRWLPPALIAVAGIASIAAYGRIPEMIPLRFDGVLPFEAIDSGSLAPRWITLSLMPALALIMWIAFRLAPTATGQRLGRRLFRNAPEAVTAPEQFARFGNTYDTIVLCVVVLLLGVHAAVLAEALKAGSVAARIIPAVLGGCFLVMGNVMPRLRPNWVAGVRTKRTLEDPQLWRTTHRAFGTAFVVSGVLTVIVGLAAPRYGLVTGIASLLLSCIVGFVVSTRAGPIASQ